MDIYEGDGGGVFGAIIGDMKQMSPVLEDFLVKASKFYSSLRTSASTADSFLEAFQKLADATTSSKGSTKDLGVSFTKLVMRHKSIENKLKTFLGVFTDNFIWPLQEKLEEHKKATSQLEKDHSKDLKRAKNDTKKAASDVIKLKKKLSKKGRQEHHEQYIQAVKIAEAHCTALEEQERHYLRRAMVEERQRMCYFFNCYRPVVEQELALIGEIENLQSILDETMKQCRNPNQLPLIADDVIRMYKAPERALLPKEAQGGSSPPNTPMVRERAQTASSLSSLASSTHSLSPTHSSGQPCIGTMTLNRSKAIQSAAGYGTLRKTGPPPKPVDLPLPGSISQPSALSANGEHRSISGNASPSYHSPTEANATPNRNTQRCGNEIGNGSDDSPVDERDVNGKLHGLKSSYPSNKLSARSSWSSTETSDSSGIGSYNSLTATGKHAGINHNNNNSNSHDSQQIVKDFLNGNTVEALETHLLGCEDIYARMTYGTAATQGHVSPRNGYERGDAHFTRNVFKSSSLRGPSGAMMNSRSMLRSSSVQHDDEHAQLTHEMKLNFQRGRNNTIAGRPMAGGRTSIFNVFHDQRGSAVHHPARSPTDGSPFRCKPPPPTRSVSYHGRGSDPPQASQRKTSAPVDPQRTFDEGLEEDSPLADPGSFLAQIQERRQTIRRHSVTEDGETSTVL